MLSNADHQSDILAPEDLTLHTSPLLRRFDSLARLLTGGIFVLQLSLMVNSFKFQTTQEILI